MKQPKPENIKPQYVWQTRVATTDVGPDRLLTPSAQLRFQQEAGELHFSEGNLGFEGVAAQGMAFLTVENNCVIYRRPSVGEPITVKTWSRNVKGAKFFRCYRFEDAAGETLIDSIASFALVDLVAHTLMRSSEFPFAVEHCPDLPHTCPDPPRLRITGDTQPIGQHTVTYSQLDFNGHLNNTRYADIVFDHLPADTVESLTGFSIAFLHEAKCGDTLELSQMQTDEHTVLIKAQNGEKVCFIAQVRK